MQEDSICVKAVYTNTSGAELLETDAARQRSALFRVTKVSLNAL